jgi:hypothetical protein
MLDAIIGKTSAIAAAVLKTFRLIILGSISGTWVSTILGGGRSQTHALIVRIPSLCRRSCTRNERIAPVPRQQPSKSTVWTKGDGQGGKPAFVWTIEPADGIRTSRHLEPAAPS